MIFIELFVTFFMIGAVTFGGGYAMLPLVQEEVLAKGWMPLSDIVNFIAIAESTPGPFAINIATYIGSEMGGLFGSVCATLGVVLPSFIVILTVARCYDAFRQNRIIAGAMTGLKPAVVGLISAAILSIARTVLMPTGAFAVKAGLAVSLVIFAIALFLVLKKKTHPVLIIVMGAALGIAAGYMGLLPV